MDVRNFSEDEISEINSYVVNQVQTSVDLNQFFILSEDPLKKIKIFVAIYRILTGVRDFVEKDETKDKLDSFLNDTKKIYEEVYPMLINYDNLATYNKKAKLRKLIGICMDTDKNLQINHLINSFLVFAEKQELLETEKVTGVNLDSNEGQDVYKKLQVKV